MYVQVIAFHSVVENIPGICQLKPEQEECLVHILNGGDVVALLPTGFGKFINCYRSSARNWGGVWLAYGYTNDFKLQTSAPPPRESKRLSIMPFQTLSTKQSEVAELGITRLRQYRRFSETRLGRFFEGKKVAKGVCNVSKLATLCISISPTMGWATGQTENTLCVNHALKKWVPLKWICVNALTLTALIYIHTLPLKSLGSVRFFMFFKDVSSAHHGCIYLIKNTDKNCYFVKYYCNLK